MLMLTNAASVHGVELGYREWEAAGGNLALVVLTRALLQDPALMARICRRDWVSTEEVFATYREQLQAGKLPLITLRCTDALMISPDDYIMRNLTHLVAFQAGVIPEVQAYTGHLVAGADQFRGAVHSLQRVKRAQIGRVVRTTIVRGGGGGGGGGGGWALGGGGGGGGGGSHALLLLIVAASPPHYTHYSPTHTAA